MKVKHGVTLLKSGVQDGMMKNNSYLELELK
jgi:hypothetical protein